MARNHVLLIRLKSSLRDPCYELMLLNPSNLLLILVTLLFLIIVINVYFMNSLHRNKMV